MFQGEDGSTIVRSVQHLYTNGDVCDITGDPRQVIVRLQCRRNAPSPSAVIIHMTEPSTCSYLLVVETLLVCDLLESADELGMISSSEDHP